MVLRCDFWQILLAFLFVELKAKVKLKVKTSFLCCTSDIADDLLQLQEEYEAGPNCLPEERLQRRFLLQTMPVWEVSREQWRHKEMPLLFKVSLNMDFIFMQKDLVSYQSPFSYEGVEEKLKWFLKSFFCQWHNQSLTFSSFPTARFPSLWTSSWRSWTLREQQKIFAALPVWVILRRDTFEEGSPSTANPQYPPRLPHHTAACATKPAVWDKRRSHLQL